jgi:AraC-like DNA-binding protein
MQAGAALTNGVAGNRPTFARAHLVGGMARLQDAFDRIDTSADASQIIILERQAFKLAGARFNISQREAQGYWEFLRLASDLFVLISDMTYRDKVPLQVPGEGFIEFHFHFTGQLSLMPASGQALDIRGPSLLIWRQAPGCDITEHIHGGVRDTTLTVYCRASALERYFGRYAETLLPHILNCADIGFLRMPIYPKLANKISNIIRSPYTDALRLASSEAMVVEMLCEVMSMLKSRQTDSGSSMGLSDRDIESLRKAQEILLACHTPPPTISEVAHRVGMCTTKLKRGFRALFDQTIHEYANGLRMDYAGELLKNRDVPIAEVAEKLGYKYQNSFTVAFKQHTGLLPKEYRRSPFITP